MQREGHVIGGGAQRPRPKDRDFLCEEDIRQTVLEGRPGLLFRLRLPSYRSLPLSCIERIELSVDGRPVEEAGMRLILGGHSYRLDELPGLSKVFWWILDQADLFVPWSERLQAGEHEVEGMMVTVEPYMTGGRYAMYYPSRRRLALASEE